MMMPDLRGQRTKTQLHNRMSQIEKHFRDKNITDQSKQNEKDNAYEWWSELAEYTASMLEDGGARKTKSSS